jgi:hypothetical protein
VLMLWRQSIVHERIGLRRCGALHWGMIHG